MEPASIQGVVTRFKGNGRKLGYPTANITTKTTLKDGVYFGFADLVNYQNNPALIFIGTPTTVGDTERRVEAYLLNIPDIDYYDNLLSLKIMHFHRSNKTLSSIEELKEIMLDDEKQAQAWFLISSNGNDRS